MDSTLLSSPRFLPSPNRDVGVLVRNFQSSFYGNAAFNKSFAGRDLSGRHGGRVVITSVLGKKVKKETVVPDPDNRIPIVLLGEHKTRAIKVYRGVYAIDYPIFSNIIGYGLAGGLAYTENLLPAAPIGLLGLLLLFQTTRVRFVFDEEALEVKVGDQLEESGENVFVGGKNCWKYSTFVNWELWWPNFPILVYFKETQTKPEGQVHFFPVIFNGRQLYDVMLERCGPSKTSGPK